MNGEERLDRAVVMTIGVSLIMCLSFVSSGLSAETNEVEKTNSIHWRTNEMNLIQVIQMGTNADNSAFFAAVKILAEQKLTNAIPALADKILCRRKPEREPKTMLGPPEKLNEAWPVAWALVQIGEPSLDALSEIIETSDDRKRVVIAGIAMEGILGFHGRDVYVKQRIEKTHDKEKVRRLGSFLMPDAPNK